MDRQSEDEHVFDKAFVSCIVAKVGARVFLKNATEGPLLIQDKRERRLRS